MIYFCDNPAAVADEALAAVLTRLPPERRARAEGMRHAGAFRLRLLAYALLLHGLEAEYGLTGLPGIEAAPRGKPFFLDRPDIFFSLSHCRAGVACALSHGAVGVDIQDVRPYRPELAVRVCTEEEREALASAENPAEAFCMLWSVKEAYCKRSGAGIGSAARLRALSAEAAIRAEGAGYAARRGEGFHIACFGADSPCVFHRVEV